MAYLYILCAWIFDDDIMMTCRIEAFDVIVPESRDSRDL